MIRRLGGEPKATIRAIEVKTTIENLAALLEVEVYQIDSMYPRFLVDNHSADNSAARTFTWALEAEKTHAQVLTEQIRQMELGAAATATGAPIEFYVRPVCG
jgi:rubrerythrin